MGNKIYKTIPIGKVVTVYGLCVGDIIVYKGCYYIIVGANKMRNCAIGYKLNLDDNYSLDVSQIPNEEDMLKLINKPKRNTGIWFLPYYSYHIPFLFPKIHPTWNDAVRRWAELWHMTGGYAERLRKTHGNITHRLLDLNDMSYMNIDRISSESSNESSSSSESSNESSSSSEFSDDSSSCSESVKEVLQDVEEPSHNISTVCSICLSRPINTLCRPCMHACSCMKCIKLCKTCPICRGDIITIDTIFIT